MSTGGTTGTAISTAGAGNTAGLGPVQPIVRTLLPINRYAEIMRINLPHFNQMAGAAAPLGRGCDKVWDQDSRDALALTISQAESLIASQIGFWPGPKFFTNESIPYGVRSKIKHREAEVKTKWKHVEGFGTEKLTLIEEDAVVYYQNVDGDPVSRPEQAVIGTSLYQYLDACSDPKDVAVFFRIEDGAEDTASEHWEIRPIKVDIDGDTMTIKIPASYMIKPSLLALTEQDCIGTSDDQAWIYNFDTDNLVGSVDVYCRTINQESPVTLKWDNACTCVTGICDHTTQIGCAHVTNDELGHFIPRASTWNGTKNIYAAYTYNTIPQKVSVNYRAGYPLNSLGRIDTLLERAIVKLTNALLPEPPCGFCDQAELIWKRDREQVDQLTLETANVPWGMFNRGSVEAWRLINRFISE